jgi:nucleoid-associated protein YgaU
MFTLLLSACGGGAAAPTPTTAPPASTSPSSAPSPQRPALSSPVPSPSSVASSPAPTSPTATTTQAAAETYEVQSGDTLLSIAQQYYGDPTLWRQIYDANKDTIGADPDKLQVGMKLNIPPKQS